MPGWDISCFLTGKWLERCQDSVPSLSTSHQLNSCIQKLQLWHKGIWSLMCANCQMSQIRVTSRSRCTPIHPYAEDAGGGLIVSCDSNTSSGYHECKNGGHPVPPLLTSRFHGWRARGCPGVSRGVITFWNGGHVTPPPRRPSPTNI